MSFVEWKWSLLVSKNQLATFFATCREVLVMFVHRERLFLIPLVLILLLTASLLIAAEFIPVLSPFVYAVF